MKTDGRAYGHVITRFSRMGRLLHFLTHGAPLRMLRARELRHYTWRTSGLNSRPEVFQPVRERSLQGVIKFSKIESYVDDTKIYFSFASKDIDSCLRQAAEDFQHAPVWCCANHLLINPDKTRFVLFGMRQLIYKLSSNITVLPLGQGLVPATSAKDLNVTICSNLTFNDHIASLSSSLLSTLVQINRLQY